MKLFILLFLCLLLPAGRELNAQNDVEELSRLAGRYYNLTGLKMSEEGRWFIVRKSSQDLTTDTVLILDHQLPEKPVAYRTQISATFFLGNDHLLLQGLQQVELLNLEELTSIYFKDIKKTQLLKSQKHFVLHWGPEEKSRLGLYDSNGCLLRSIDNVIRFHIAESGNIYTVVEKEEKHFEIFFSGDTKTEKLYTSSRQVEYLDVDPEEQGLMFFVRKEENSTQEMVYLDLGDKTAYPLKEVLPIPFDRGFPEVIREGDACFLKLLIQEEKTDTSLVDIWYGNDNRLEEKLYPSTRRFYFVWEPKRRTIRQIGNDELPQVINTGNKSGFLSFSPFKMNDYTVYSSPVRFEMHYYNEAEKEYNLIDTVAAVSYCSPDGEYLLWPLYSSNNYRLKSPRSWTLFHIPTGHRHIIENSVLSRPYFTTDRKGIVFEGEEALWRYDLKSRQLERLVSFPGFQTNIVNGNNNSVDGAARIYKNSVDLMSPLILRLYDPSENKCSYMLYHKGRQTTVIPTTSSRITHFRYNGAYDRFCYIEENYNLPPQLVFKQLKKKEKVLYKSNPDDSAIRSLQQEIFSYTNSEGRALNGILYYPLHYDASKRYPMVVHIYEIQRERSNHYPASRYGSANFAGFDLRLLLEKRYFVYFPDIVYGPEGTGLSALDCVHRGLDAIDMIPSIDKSKIGLIGHSHGGYQANFIATHSDRFATYVSGAGNSDIVRSYFSFNYNFTSPFYWQFENGQYQMHKSFSEDKDLYFQNNPIYYVDQVDAPILLWAGMKDQNIDWNQTMEFYIGLKRNRKKVISLFYPNEGHTIMDNRTSKDLCVRILDWFDYFLKGDKNVEWINNEIKKDARK